MNHLCSNLRCSLPLNNFIGSNGKPTKTCEKCYIQRRDFDLKRKEKTRLERENLCDSLKDGERVCSNRNCHKTYIAFLNKRKKESKYCKECYENSINYERERNRNPDRISYTKSRAMKLKEEAKLQHEINQKA